MTVGELANKTGVPASTIRYWESMGVLPAARRVSGQRRYTNEAIDRLATLQMAQACGFRLKEMRDLMQGFDPATTPGARWRKLAGSKLDEVGVEIERLLEVRRMLDQLMQCQCMDLNECGRATKRPPVVTRRQIS